MAGDAMNAKVRIELDPLGIVLEAERGSTLESLLAEYGVEFPCGASGICGGCRVAVLEGVVEPQEADLLTLTCASGICGGCRVQVLEGVVEPQEAELLTLTDAELAAGHRLACRIRADSPLKLKVEQWSMPGLNDGTAAPRATRRGLAAA